MEDLKGKTVVVGLSGGVDSSVAALLLKQRGASVIGVFMRNWTDNTVLKSDDCHWIDDSNDAMLVAEKLAIPFQVLDLSESYKNRIIDYMFKEYESGRTPNPDILCNREIKFDVFLKSALQLGADYVATGHYCQKKEITSSVDKKFGLFAGADLNKDQSYFLCQITQKQLSKILFPIGHLQKSEVRNIAGNANLITAEKKDSQGLCFVGKVKLPEFLQMQLKPKKGMVVEIGEDASIFIEHANQKPSENLADTTYLNWASKRWEFTPEMGTIIGEHQGAHYYTIGQRKGLGIGGKPLPLFILQTNTNQNIIYTGQGENHPGLSGIGLFMKHENVSFINEGSMPILNNMIRIKARIRYRQPLQDAYLIHKECGFYLIFDLPQTAIAPGQFAAWYQDDELLGSGTIAM
jgi:tRNA-specific 2-thiouridylase